MRRRGVAGQVLIGVTIVWGPEQAEIFHAADLSGLDGVVIVSDQDIPGALQPSVVPGFNAGANRDIGIAAARIRFPGCSVVLLDGDCAPGPTWAASHRGAAEVSWPVVACGSKMESGVDPRCAPLDWQGWRYNPSFQPSGSSPSLSDVLAHRVTWTCNLSINDAALSRLEALAPAIHGCRRIFAPMFDGEWGGEDTGLGLLAWRAGCNIVTLDPEESAVTHSPHASRITSVRNLRRIHDYYKTVFQAEEANP